MIRRLPVVVILGSTGTGKTKLSLELAQRYNGEVISADSMQVYSGLDIGTAKATKMEQALAKHHLLDVAKPGVLYSVRQFQQSALPIIDDLLKAQKMPIIVGGTNYYIESLLWKILVDEWQHCGSDNEGDMPHAKKAKFTEERMFGTADMDKMTSEELHERLKGVDLEAANKLHPNNRRKIIRALEVYERSGKPYSDFIKEQQSQLGGSDLGGPLRYENLVIFWMFCDQDSLNKRLDKRVDEMVAQGLLREIRSFHEKYVKPFEQQQDYTKGILQTIGFKEFIPYLEKYDENEDIKLEEFMKNSGVDAPAGLNVLNECLDQLKLVTRRYSKKQIKWIKNRFLRAPERNRPIPPIYKLDTSNPRQWEELVSERAINVIESYQSSSVELQVDPERLGADVEMTKDSKVPYNCDVCGRLFIGEFQWNIHLKSNRHRKMKCKSKI